VFVCTGNICRSAMAEAMARSRTGPESGVNFGSAGLYSLDGAPAASNAIEAAAEIGVDVTPHRARGLSRKVAESADAIYVMTASHRVALLAMEPALGGKVELLDPGGEDIGDPYGRDLEAYRRARDQIVKALDARLEDWKS